MESLSSTDIIEKESLKWDYKQVMNIVLLSLCCKDNIEGSQQVSSFNSLFPDEVERERRKTGFGRRFDDEMINFVTTAMALRRKNVTLDMGDDHGIFQDNRFGWEKGLQDRIGQLNKNKERSDRLTVEVVKSPLPSQEEAYAISDSELCNSLATRRSEGLESDRGTLVA